MALASVAYLEVQKRLWARHKGLQLGTGADNSQSRSLQVRGVFGYGQRPERIGLQGWGGEGILLKELVQLRCFLGD